MGESPGFHIRQYEIVGDKYMRGGGRSLDEMREAMPRRPLPFDAGTLSPIDPEKLRLMDIGAEDFSQTEWQELLIQYNGRIPAPHVRKADAQQESTSRWQ